MVIPWAAGGSFPIDRIFLKILVIIFSHFNIDKLGQRFCCDYELFIGGTWKLEIGNPIKLLFKFAFIAEKSQRK